MGLVKQAVSGVKWSGAATALHVGSHALTLMVLARLLTPSDFGLFGIASVVTGLVNTFRDFGLTDAVVYNQQANRAQLSTLYWINMAFSWLCFFIIFIIAPLVATYYQEPEVLPLLRWSAVYFLIVPIGQQFQGMLRKELRFRTRSLIQMSDVIIYSLSVVFLAYIGLGVMSMIWATLIRAVISAMLLLLVAHRSNWLPMLHFKATELKGFLNFGVFYTLEKVFSYLSRNLDILFIGRFAGVEVLGFYTIAVNLVKFPVSYIAPLVNSVAFPSFARVQDDTPKLKRGYTKILRYLSSILVLLLAGLGLAAPAFVPLFYGAQWAPAVSLVQILCLYGLLLSLIDIAHNLLLAKGRTDIGLLITIFSTAGYAIAIWIGSRWDAVGVAMSITIFTLVVLWPVDFYVRDRLINMSFSEYWKGVKSVFIAGFFLVLTGVVIHQVLKSESKVIELLTIAGIGAGVYGITLWWFDADLIRDVLSDFAPRFAKRVCFSRAKSEIES